MATSIRGPGLIPSPGQNPGQISFPFQVEMLLSYIHWKYFIYVELHVSPLSDLVPTGVLAGTTRALVPAPTGDAREADPVVGVAAGATAVPQCRTVADILATGYVMVLPQHWQD